MNNKKNVCLKNPATAYYSGGGGVYAHAVVYGVDDYLYCTSGNWSGAKQYHKLKIYYTAHGGAFVMLHGYKMPLGEFIRI